MKGWYGDKMGHSLASRGINTKLNENERKIINLRIKDEVYKLREERKNLDWEIDLYLGLEDWIDIAVSYKEDDDDFGIFWGSSSRWEYDRWIKLYNVIKNEYSEYEIEAFLNLIKLYDKHHKDKENYKGNLYETLIRVV